MNGSQLGLSAVQRDRAVGVLLGTAAGDALGAGYEFRSSMPADEPVGMIGGGLGPFEPGEWTDDTSMAIAIAEVAATGADLADQGSQDDIVQRWFDWAQTAKDVGVQTSSVLRTAARTGIGAVSAREAAAEHHRSTGRSAGNGSLMRTAPVALAYLHDQAALVSVARALSELTHFDPEAGDACVLWCSAIRHAVLTGELNIRLGLGHIDPARRNLWSDRLDEAERLEPSAFAGNNGWVVSALQGAWSAISSIAVPANDVAAEVFGADWLRLSLEAAVRGGGDTDTVAAIAGGLLGAVTGASAVPWQWRRMLHGWPGLTARGLAQLAERIIDGGAEPADPVYPTVYGYQGPVRHPHDDEVWIGAAPSLSELPSGIDAIVSLCRVADTHLPEGATHLDVRLIDKIGANAHLDYVLLDTVRAVEGLRAEGRTVFLHCAAGQSRTPAIAALYGSRRQGIDIDSAVTEVCAVLTDAEPNPEFRAALRRLRPN